MKDRIPRYPGRVKLTPVPGSTNLFDMERADEPTQVGTPLNKTTFLTDAVAQKIGLSGDPTVSEAIDKLQLLTTVTPKIVEITESQNFIVPKAIGQRFFVLMCGGGGGMNWTKSCGGGGSGYIYRGWVTLPQGQSIPCTIGASGTKPDNYSWGASEAGANGGTTKLGSYASAAGGYGGSLGGSTSGSGKGGNGNAGGGGSSLDNVAGDGGDGGTYGGGGGGGSAGVGGKGGTYGGGGGGGFMYGNTTTHAGGTGGTYGGHGATSKGGNAENGTKFRDLLLHVLFDRSFFERPYTAGENKGTNAGGAGGGGYGGKGGIGRVANSSFKAGSGGGGGGYGGDGGNANLSAGSGGSGGGGYGGRGGFGDGGPGGGGGLYIGISLPDGQSIDSAKQAIGYGAGESKSNYSNKGTYPAASGVIYLLYYPCD